LRMRLVIVVVTCGLAAACSYQETPDPLAGGEGQSSITAADESREVEAWRRERMSRLTGPEGWLSLVGLTWLKPGPNSLGSAAGNDVVLPQPAAARAGTLVLNGSSVTATLDPAAGVTIDGHPASSSVVLRDDGDAAGPSILRTGTLAFYVVRRGSRTGIRVKDSASAVRRTFRGIEHYPVDPAWRFTARFEPYSPPRQIAIPTILGTTDMMPSPGALVFMAGGQEYRLDPVLEEPGAKEFFVIFRDATSGHGTYGAGRFLYTKPPGPDGTTLLDFNKAYNPPCAFTPYATCPLPPPQNRLPIAIEAGEKNYGHH
jgi:uncharacterized protein (DUF1684 family)